MPTRTTPAIAGKEKSRYARCGAVWRVALLLSLLLLSSLCAAGQEEKFAIRAGTRLRVQMENSIDTKTGRIGDVADATVIEPVGHENTALLPVGTRLRGRVAAIQAEDKKQHAHAMLQLAFNEIVLSDGRRLKADASLQSLGTSENVDSRGIATIHPLSHDFQLKSGRKLWLRLDADLDLSNENAAPSAALAAVDSPVPRPDPVPAKHEMAAVTLTAGTRVRARMNTTVDTKSGRVGDGVEAVLIEPVNRDNVIILPSGTRLRGRVVTIRAADKKQKSRALLRLSFDEVILPDDRRLKTRASIQSLGLSEDVDAEGAATAPGVSKGDTVAATATGGAAGAGIGAIAGGGKGAGVGAGVGSAVGLLSALAAGAGQWDNFELKKGRKLWLRFDEDVMVSRYQEP